MEMGKSIVSGDETLIIRRYDPKNDEQKVLDLWQSVFQKEISFSLWRWKYLETPYETAMLICENSKGMPVVLYGGIPYASTCRNKEMVMIHLSDIMSHPDYRGSGLFIHAANAYFDDFGTMDKTHVMYGFPGKYHFDIGAKYLQYSPLGRGPAYFKSKGETLKSQRCFISGKIFQCTVADTGFDRIWDNVSTTYPLSVIRNRAYVNWRYFQHPEKTYEVWQYRPPFTRESQAFMVIQVREKTAVVVDLLVPDSEKHFCDFFGNMAAMLLKRGIQNIETWVPEDHFVAAFFSGCGFEKLQEPIGIIPTIRLFDNTLDLNWSGKHFYYTMGDGDLF